MNENINRELLITSNDYTKIFNLVLNFLLQFSGKNENMQKNFDLKREHTKNVINYSKEIAVSLNCTEDQLLIVQLIALLHDVGRFEQFNQYETFNDSISVDHAELGVKIIRENEWLNGLNSDTQELILKAIFNHNKIAIEKNEKTEVIFYSKIIRDADKLDIWDISVHEYSPKKKLKNNSFTLDLDNSLLISPEVVKSILSGKLPDRKDLKTINDFKLMQIAWVFDINFKQSYAIINTKQFIKQIFDTLPKSDQVFEIYRKAKIHAENQL